MSQTAPDPRTEQRATLSRDLSDFLTEFSIAVHRYAMYPLNHPSLGPATTKVVDGLHRLLESREQLSLGVAQRQLVIDGLATDSKHPVLADLARRLHDHQLGAVTFLDGVGAWEMEALLSTLSADPEREGTPIGELPEGDLPSWAHITLYPVGYDRLEMSGEAAAGPPEPARATQLWLGLAQAAMATDGALDPNDPPDAGTVAQTLRQHRPEGAYDQAIVGYLLQLADELKNSSDGESEAIRRRLSQLIQDLDQPTLRRMVEMGGDATRRQRFVMDTNQTLAVDAVMKVLQAAADASEQTISTSLARMLTKLAARRGGNAAHPRGGGWSAQGERLGADRGLGAQGPES